MVKGSSKGTALQRIKCLFACRKPRSPICIKKILQSDLHKENPAFRRCGGLVFIYINMYIDGRGSLKYMSELYEKGRCYDLCLLIEYECSEFTGFLDSVA